MIAGKDVSQWQGEIDWPKVAAASISGERIRFAYVRAACGTHEDPLFVVNAWGARAAGLAVGAYQYGVGGFQGGVCGGDEAHVFLSLVGDAGGPKVFDLPPALDLEAWPGEGSDQQAVIQYLRTWAGRVAPNAWPGGSPIIYSDPGFWNPLGLGAGKEGGFGGGAWVAYWGAKEPTLLTPFPSWRFWQYSDHGTVDGITGPVDLDWFIGGAAGLFPAKRASERLGPREPDA